MKTFKIVLLTSVFILGLTSCKPDLSTSNIKAQPTDESNKIKKEAALLIEDLKYNEAISKFKDHYEIIQNDDMALEAYGYFEGYIFQNYDKAETLLKRAIALNPTVASHYVLQGFLYENQKKYKAAIKEYNKALKSYESNEEDMWNAETSFTYQFIGNCYMKLHNEKSALDNLDKAIKHNPYNIDANATLHQLYVQKEEYDKAYLVWKTDNYINDNGNNPYIQLEKWNEMYKTVLPEKGSKVSHIKMAELYSSLVLYDEAKIEYEKALKEDKSNSEIINKASEIDTYISFRGQLQNLLNKHYRSRCINGIEADAQFYTNIEPAYIEIAKQFPSYSKKTGSTQVWIDAINREIEKKFNVRIYTLNVTQNKMGIHFGRIIDVSAIHSELFGRKADLRTVTLKNMVSNGLDYWRSANGGGVGGWGGSRTEIVRVVQNRESLGIISYALMYNKNHWDNIQKKAAEYDRGLNAEEKAPLDLYYSAALANEMNKRQIEIDVDKLTAKNMVVEDIYQYLFINFENKILIESVINMHESQHSIDNIYGQNTKWLGENEYRPKLAQLAYSDMSFAVLASFYTPYINSDIQETHIQADSRIFKNIVQYIYDNSSEYPEINIKKNILSQISKLNENDLKEIAFAIFYMDYPDTKN